MQGTVRFFNDQRKFGLIDTVQLQDPIIFFANDIEGASQLCESEMVEFEPIEQPDGRGLKATRVRTLETLITGTVGASENGAWRVVADDGRDLCAYPANILGTGYKSLEVGQRVGWFAEARDRFGRTNAERIFRLDHSTPFTRFALLGDFEEQVAKLDVLLASKESWQYKSSPQAWSDFPILINYLEYTFQRLRGEEGKILEAKDTRDRRILCFNTGLATPLEEYIFAFFLENPNPMAPYYQKWCLAGFKKESERAMAAFSPLPEIADYFEDPADLIYDKRLDLRINYDHIIRDNDKRFPEALQGNDFLKKELLKASVDTAKKRVRRNYKTAIPQYYKGQLQLLLPLCLGQQEGKADAALTVTKENGCYIASTILTLDMAYNNARLIAKPDDEWLRP